MVILHGAVVFAQSLPEVSTGVEQHAVLPPGRSLHPESPHLPQLLAQHAWFPATEDRIPPALLHCAVSLLVELSSVSKLQDGD